MTPEPQGRPGDEPVREETTGPDPFEGDVPAVAGDGGPAAAAGFRDDSRPGGPPGQAPGPAADVEPAGEAAAGPGRPGQQAELDLGVVATGHPAVDEALARLEPLASLPVEEHPAVYDDVHAAVRRALTELDAE